MAVRTGRAGERPYTAFAKAVAEGIEVPVPVSEAIEVLRVLDAARASALNHRVVELG